MKQRLLNSLNRNTFLFLGGLFGVAHETLLQHAERPTLLILFAAMMGLPAFLPTGGRNHSDRIEQIRQMGEEERTNRQIEEIQQEIGEGK